MIQAWFFVGSVNGRDRCRWGWCQWHAARQWFSPAGNPLREKVFAERSVSWFLLDLVLITWAFFFSLLYLPQEGLKVLEEERREIDAWCTNWKNTYKEKNEKYLFGEYYVALFTKIIILLWKYRLKWYHARWNVIEISDQVACTSFSGLLSTVPVSAKEWHVFIHL